MIPMRTRGDGLCETNPGNSVCSLRAAIEEANAQPTDDTINFDIPVADRGYNGTSWTISLLSALPDLSSNLTIEGPGPDLLAVTRSSASLFRIFRISSAVTVSVFRPHSEQRECRQRERRRNSEREWRRDQCP